MDDPYLPPHVVCNVIDVSYGLSWEQIDEINASAEKVYADCRADGCGHVQAYALASEYIFDILVGLGIFVCCL